jgi:hypothetical protein
MSPTLRNTFTAANCCPAGQSVGSSQFLNAHFSPDALSAAVAERGLGDDARLPYE